MAPTEALPNAAAAWGACCSPPGWLFQAPCLLQILSSPSQSLLWSSFQTEAGIPVCSPSREPLFCCAAGAGPTPSPHSSPQSFSWKERVGTGGGEQPFPGRSPAHGKSFLPSEPSSSEVRFPSFCHHQKALKCFSENNPSTGAITLMDNTTSSPSFPLSFSPIQP